MAWLWDRQALEVTVAAAAPPRPMKAAALAIQGEALAYSCMQRLEDAVRASAVQGSGISSSTVVAFAVCSEELGGPYSRNVRALRLRCCPP